MIDAYRLGYAGYVAAALPGLALGFLGIVGLACALPISVAMVLGYVAIRTGLRTLRWYRWYFGLSTVSTVIFGAIAQLAPDYKIVGALAWAFAQIVILSGFYSYFAGYDPPAGNIIPRG